MTVTEDVLPAPNPPQSTTDQLRRELGLLQSEVDRRLISAATLTDEKVKGTVGRMDKFTEALTGQIDVLRQRLDDMDRANAVLNETVTRVPTDVQREVQHLRELMFSSTGSLEKQVVEKFSAIGQQFAERDVRTEQSSTAANQALNAALQAAKELVGAQGEASAAAAVKSETSFTKQIDQIGTIIQTLEKALDARITELKERIDRGEGNTSGARVQQDDSRAITAEGAAKRSGTVAFAAFAVSLVFLLIASISLVVALTRKPAPAATPAQPNLSCSVAAAGMTCVKP